MRITTEQDGTMVVQDLKRPIVLESEGGTHMQVSFEGERATLVLGPGVTRLGRKFEVDLTKMEINESIPFPKALTLQGHSIGVFTTGNVETIIIFKPSISTVSETSTFKLNDEFRSCDLVDCFDSGEEDTHTSPRSRIFLSRQSDEGKRHTLTLQFLLI